MTTCLPISRPLRRNARSTAFVLATMLALGSTLLAPAANAQPMPDAAPDVPGIPLPIASVTISPILLVFPVVELTAEYRVSPLIGVAFIGGFGKITEETTNTGVTLWELGAQANAYVLGDFRHGLHLGVEAIYLGASAESGNVSATATGLSAGGYVGYKWAASFGFTFVFQLGYQINGVGADATDGTTTASKKESDSGPLANLNIGWSF